MLRISLGEQGLFDVEIIVGSLVGQKASIGIGKRKTRKVSVVLAEGISRSAEGNVSEAPRTSCREARSVTGMSVSDGNIQNYNTILLEKMSK